MFYTVLYFVGSGNANIWRIVSEVFSVHRGGTLVFNIANSLVSGKRFWFVSGAIVLIFLSIFIVWNLSGQPSMKVLLVERYMAFAIGIASLYTVVIAAIRQKTAKIITGIFSTIIIIFLVFPIWSYYLTNGVFFDTTSVLAIFQTNPDEAYGYLEHVINACVVVSLIVSAFLFIAILSSAQKLKLSDIVSYSKLPYILIIFLALDIFLIYRSRQNVVCLPYLNARDYIKNYVTFQMGIKKRENITRQIIQNADEINNGLYVIVIGESETRDHMHAYGYNEENTPWLSSMADNSGCVVFSQGYSSYVQTVPSLMYALTAKNQYNGIAMENAISLVEVAKVARFTTIWISNQGKFGMYDAPITVIASETDHQIWVNEKLSNGQPRKYDGEIIENINVDELSKNHKTLLIIHLMGSHMTYKDRYPRKFDKFSDKTDNKNSFSCYDNSVLYNDYVMKSIYNRVKDVPNFKALVYFSDHGEEVTVDHDPNKFTWAMTRIPMYMIFSDEYIRENKGVVDGLRLHKDTAYTNDLIFNTMMSIMGIDMPSIYEPENDFTKASYDGSKDRLKTLYGKRRLSEEQ
ncbi:MAG: phosphoethanolamine transferase [Selenomonadaceae bacterium]